jgi:hypothetical protein
MIKSLTLLGIAVVLICGSLVQFTSTSTGDTGSSGSPAPLTRTLSPDPRATPEVLTNRQDCDAIRGTDYLSPDERTWYLANCVTR